MLNGTTTRSPTWSPLTSAPISSPTPIGSAPRLHPVDLRSDLLHDPDRLVADDVALLHLDDLAAVEVQVRSADRRGRDPDDRVGRFLDGRVVDLVDADVLFAVPNDCSHERRGTRSAASLSAALLLLRAGMRRALGVRFVF